MEEVAYRLLGGEADPERTRRVIAAKIILNGDDDPGLLEESR
ncbi:MAG TPA: hypothetical protein VF192_01435 [Longimicrobiales bacterium]